MTMRIFHYLAADGRDVFQDWLEGLLLCGGSKRTQDSDISRAVDCWRDYVRRRK
jgi:putative component of toxin-antitoxin plasmid stabilization module